MPDGLADLVLGGIIALLMGADTKWEYKDGIDFIATSLLMVL